MANEEPASGRVVADLSLRLRNLEAAIRNLKGWRRGLTLAGLGGMSATAFAPFYLLPAYVIAFVALVGFLDSAASQNKSHRRAFLTGWWFGSGFHLIGLHWLAFAFLVQAEQFAWMAPFAVVGMALFLGLFFGAACLLAHWIASTGPYRVVVLAASIALAEFVRGHILTGLPWNLPAQMMAGTATTAQPAAWLGPYGYSFIILVVAVSPVFVFNTLKTTALEKRLAFACLAPVAAYIAIYLGGSARMVILPEPEPTGVRVTVVQPNIPQKEKIDPSLWNRNIQKAIERSRDPETSSTTRYVIWPENAAPLLDENLSAQKAIAQSLSSNDILLTGAVRRGLETTNKWRVFNSILALEVDANAGIARPIASYDKHHLAPFGEYLPLRPLLTAIGLSQLAPYDEGFKAGPGPQTLEIGPAPFAPLICYETVFPGALFPKDRRPKWLVTVTNDAWFGDAAGPKQHLDQARLRSIETGLPMARAANTGISGVFDAKGRLLSDVPLYETGSITLPLPGAGPITLYQRFGEWPALAIMLAGLLGGPLASRQFKQ